MNVKFFRVHQEINVTKVRLCPSAIWSSRNRIGARMALIAVWQKVHFCQMQAFVSNRAYTIFIPLQIQISALIALILVLRICCTYPNNPAKKQLVNNYSNVKESKD